MSRINQLTRDERRGTRDEKPKSSIVLASDRRKSRAKSRDVASGRPSSVVIYCLIIIAVITQCSYAAEEGFVYQSKARRDPFIPLIGKGAELLIPEQMKSIEGIVLEGIIFDPERGSMAIVNGEIFKEGQSVGGFMLSRINERNIILIRDGENYIVNLIEEE